MATKNQLVSDIILRISKGKPADDLELEPKQVAFWIGLVLDGLVKDTLDDNLANATRVADFYVIKETCKWLEEETYACIAAGEQKMYVQTSKPVLELINDSAIIRVTTNEGSRVDKSRLSTIDFVEDMEFSKPSIKNLVYYRDGQKKLVICGIPNDLVDVVEIFVWYVPQTNLDCFLDDEELPISSDIIEELQMRVEELARRQMAGFGDVTNDGFDDLPTAQQ